MSEIRATYKETPTGMLSAKELTKRFKTSYNIDYVTLKKLAQKSDAKYVLLITSNIDAENYILRRTFWDFLNIPGASVIDPAYKISTYAVLVDAENNNKLWADTFYKTISVVENRIITRGYSPQTEQLQKIKDYSRLICPQIAQSVQARVLPPDIYEQETKQVQYGIGNIDNVFTKKTRQYSKECGSFYSKKKTSLSETIRQKKEEYAKRKLEKQAEQEVKKEVKATPLYSNPTTDISNKVKEDGGSVKELIFKKKMVDTEIEGIDIQKSKKNNLNVNFELDQPELRDYYN